MHTKQIKNYKYITKRTPSYDMHKKLRYMLSLSVTIRGSGRQGQGVPKI